MSKKNILVFPCGSEIGLELHRALCYSSQFNLFGASSIDDHGYFVYENYIGNLPLVTEPDFINKLSQIAEKNSIDVIYPTMDMVATVLKKNEDKFRCKVIASPFETMQICMSKKKTYDKLKKVLVVPHLYKSIDEIKKFPVFIKPIMGYGSRGTKKANTRMQVESHLSEYNDCLLLEYLPGKEFTVDCFTDFKRSLRYVGYRERKRISNGISVHTVYENTENEIISKLAKTINENIEFRGAWFFQLKENVFGELALLEIAGRFAGSSAVQRCNGINFASLSIFDSFEIDVDICNNDKKIELDRALENKYKINFKYNTVYVDLDDCLVINGKINTQLVSFLYQAINNKKTIVLITKHNGNLNEVLQKMRISNLFDKVIHLGKYEEKYMYVDSVDGIFIDDSFVERKKIYSMKNIPVFAPDSVECLLA